MDVIVTIIKEGVRMSSNDNINILHLLGKFNIFADALMAKCDNLVDTRCHQASSLSLHSLYFIPKRYTLYAIYQ